MGDHNFEDIRLSQDSVTSLQPRLRIAVSVYVLQSVAFLYSEYFRLKYHQNECIYLLWQYVLEGIFDRERASELIATIEDMQDEADDEDYTGDALWPSILFIHELFAMSGKDSMQGVDYAALMYANRMLFQQGCCSFDPIVETDYYYSLTDNVYIFARSLFSYCLSKSDIPISREMFSQYSLSLDVPLLSSEIIGKRTTVPPIHEYARGRGVQKP